MTRRLVRAAGIAAGICLAGCRYQTVWSGVEFNRAGTVLRLASEEPFCGSLTLVNISGRAIILRARLADGLERGRVELKPGERLTEGFDWAGAGGPDSYYLEALSPDGNSPVLVLRNLVRVDGIGWPFRPCESPESKIGALHMNAGIQANR